MEFSTDWITQYVDMPAGGTAEIAERLTASGMAVEGRREAPGVDGTDVVFDIDVTTNRPDCMNHLGLARELAVLTGAELRPPSDEVDEDTTETASSLAVVRIEDHKLCPRFVALVLRDVKVGPSPDWMVKRLEAIGKRSINNIVDVTNYAMWETGQPMHAYDLDLVAKNGDGKPEFVVRLARDGESTLTTLDDEERKLDPSILVVTDPSGPIGLGGVMGGASTEVSEATTTVLLEAAHWDPTTIRKGRAKLGMHTDASHRFERGADPEACLWTARRAAALMVEVAGGRVVSGHLDVHELRADWPPRVDLDLGRLNAFGGTEIDAATAERILTGLGFELKRHGQESVGLDAVAPASVAKGDAIRWSVTAPSWRWYDFEGVHAQDVYEEVLRAYGFDNIPTTLPSLGAPDGRTGPDHKLRRKVQDVLSAAGLTEAVNFAFHDAGSDAAYPSLYGDRAPMLLANPLSERYSTMRRSLLPNLIDSARFNQRRNAEAVRLFEIGHVFVAGKASAGESTGDEHDASDWGHDEMDAAAVVMGGNLGTPWEHSVALDFYDLKGVLETLAVELDAKLTFRAAELPRLAAGATAEILLGGTDEVVGHLGRLDDEDDLYPLYVAEIALAPLGRAEPDLETQPPSRYPGVAVDSTLTHAKSIPWSDLAAAIEASRTADLVRFDLQDRYDGQGVPDGAVNTTIHFLYNAEGRSLTQEEVNERHTALTTHLESQFGLA